MAGMSPLGLWLGGPDMRVMMAAWEPAGPWMYLYYASATVNQRDDSQPGLGSQSQNFVKTIVAGQEEWTCAAQAGKQAARGSKQVA